jgi:putative ABC transport system ATP-binding protein
MSIPVLRFDGVVKAFPSGTGTVRALDGLTLDVGPGGFTAIVGRSGSGKSTLLNLAAGIDTPTSGEVLVDGQPLSRLSDDALTHLRRDRIGVVYQFFHLLPTLDVRENVALPLLLAGRPERDALAAADARLAEVELAPRARARPHTLSGGELQRAAVARALVHEPSLVLADEPTGNLDTRSAAQVVELMATPRPPPRRHADLGHAQPRRRRGRRPCGHAFRRARRGRHAPRAASAPRRRSRFGLHRERP